MGLKSCQLPSFKDKWRRKLFWESIVLPIEAIDLRVFFSPTIREQFNRHFRSPIEWDYDSIDE